MWGQHPIVRECQWLTDRCLILMVSSQTCSPGNKGLSIIPTLLCSGQYLSADLDFLTGQREALECLLFTWERPDATPPNSHLCHTDDCLDSLRKFTIVLAAELLEIRAYLFSMVFPTPT